MDAPEAKRSTPTLLKRLLRVLLLLNGGVTLLTGVSGRREGLPLGSALLVWPVGLSGRGRVYVRRSLDACRSRMDFAPP